MAVDSLSLTVYIPSYGRWERCLAQVAAVRRAARRAASIEVHIVVAVNGDRGYTDVALRDAGADVVITRRLNLGANANIALGFEFLSTSTYLWVLSDDELITDSVLTRVEPLLHEGVDVVSAAWSTSSKVQEVANLDQLDASGAFYALVSANILRGSSFDSNVEQAFDGIITSYPHAYLISRTLVTRTLVVATIPMNEMINHSLSLEAVTGMNRKTAGRAQGTAFFGGGILVAVSAVPGGSAGPFHRWWRKHWHRAAMYRRSRSVQARIVDSMARGSLRSLPWYLVSLVPWWRLKERIRPRHARD